MLWSKAAMSCHARNVVNNPLVLSISQLTHQVPLSITTKNIVHVFIENLLCCISIKWTFYLLRINFAIKVWDTQLCAYGSEGVKEGAHCIQYLAMCNSPTKNKRYLAPLIMLRKQHLSAIFSRKKVSFQLVFVQVAGGRVVKHSGPSPTMP